MAGTGSRDDMKQIGVPLVNSLFAEAGTVSPSGSQQITVLFQNVLQLQQGFVTRTPVSANYTALVSDFLIGVSTTGGARTITLPTPTTALIGKAFIIVDETGNAVANNITVQYGTGPTIVGTINTAFGSLWVYTNGTIYIKL
jgi:hypothetical protein